MAEEEKATGLPSMEEMTRNYVASLYEKELGRTGSGDAGLDLWTNAILSNAMTREQVAAEINNSAEGQRFDLGTTYQKQLGRTGTVDEIAAKDPGLQAWANAVSSGQMTLAQAQEAIARSQEGARYDVARIYGSDLDRKGTYDEIAKSDPGAAMWASALQSGAITEQQFIDAVRQSQEYKNRMSGDKTVIDDKKDSGKTDTVTDALKKQQDAFDKQMAEWKKTNDASMQAYQEQVRLLQDGLLKTNATRNSVQGQFGATSPYSWGNNFGGLVATQSPGLSMNTAASYQPGTATGQVPGTSQYTPQTGFAATYPGSTAASAITPAPGYYVPQTYLAPPPPQYRNVNPFQSPFGNPFESYFTIANRRRFNPYQYQYPDGTAAGQETILPDGTVAAKTTP